MLHFLNPRNGGSCAASGVDRGLGILQLALEKSVLEGDARLIHEHLERVQSPQRTPGLGVVSDQQGYGLTMGHEGKDGDLDRAEATHLAEQVGHPAPLARGAGEGLAPQNDVLEESMAR